jgi:hypothetical protein
MGTLVLPLAPFSSWLREGSCRHCCVLPLIGCLITGLGQSAEHPCTETTKQGTKIIFFYFKLSQVFFSVTESKQSHEVIIFLSEKTGDFEEGQILLMIFLTTDNF